MFPYRSPRSISPAIRVFRQSCTRPGLRCLALPRPVPSLRAVGTFADTETRQIPRWLKYGAPILVGGGLLYAFEFSRHPELHTLVNSPAIIPPAAKREIPFIIPSPPDITLFERITSLLRRHIFSPLRTGLRFLHLLVIFSPVIFASPMLFIGVSDPQHGGERWGAVWWYDLLTRSMQRAGPTFIKVSILFCTRFLNH